MVVSKALWQQLLDGSSNKLAAGKCKHFLGLAVDEHDVPAVVDDHHGIGKRVEQRGL
jgi:hypothetical protein